MGRVPLAIISHVLTPYRLHVHRRVAREMPEIELHSLFTHDQPDQPWDLEATADIRPVAFGKGHAAQGRAHPRHVPRDLAKARRIARYITTNGVRAVVMCGYSDACRVALMLWLRWRGIPVLLFNDGNIRSEKPGSWRRIVKALTVRPLMRCCSAFLPCGTLGAALMHRAGARSERIFFFPYEPEYALIARATRAQGLAELQAFGLPDQGRRRIVFCGRMIPEKRPGVALEAFAALAPSRPEWDLVLIGDGPLRADLQARVPPDLAARVAFTGFIGAQERIAAIERACDVLVLPSAYEPWGLVVNEAVAAGMAVVSSDAVGAAAELVKPGMNGEIVSACAEAPGGDPVDEPTRVPGIERPALTSTASSTPAYTRFGFGPEHTAWSAAFTRALGVCTAADRIDGLKAGSAPVLAEWRRRGDPVDGLRRALHAVGVL